MAWTAVVQRTTGEFITAAIWNAELNTNLTLLKVNYNDSGGLAIGGFDTLTLAAGVVTVKRSNSRLRTQGGAGTDDLDTITFGVDGSGLTLTTGAVIKLMTFSSGEDVVVKHGTGNLSLAGGADHSLLIGEPRYSIILLANTSSTWVELTRTATS